MFTVYETTKAERLEYQRDKLMERVAELEAKAARLEERFVKLDLSSPSGKPLTEAQRRGLMTRLRRALREAESLRCRSDRLTARSVWLRGEGPEPEDNWTTDDPPPLAS